MRITNPATGKVITEMADDTRQTVDAKFAKAKKAQPAWAARPIDERIACIQKFYDAIDAQKEKVAKDETAEVGKPIQESLNEIGGARKRTKFFLDNAKQWLANNPVNVDGNTKEVIGFEPLGVIANISAWNYPLLVGVNVYVPALIAGNAVLYKPSEYATLTGLNVARLMHEAGVPDGIFIPVVGGGVVGEALLDLPCDGYFFTGSVKTGKLIAARAAVKLVPVGLELGGKDPLYVTDELADIAQVAGAVAEGCFYNNGQSCCAVERVYVNAKVYDEFMKHFVAEAKKLKVGDPTDRANTQGAITRPVQVDFLADQVKDAVDKGAKLLTGGKRVAGAGSFFTPTVLADANHTMRVMMEETFGPVIGVMKVADDAEAVTLINDCEYGLTAAIFSSNIERAKKIVGQVDAGSAYVNCCDRVSPYLPWSGRKDSGLGSTLSFLGILAFTKPRGWHIRG